MAQILANFHSDAGSDLGKPWAKEDAGNYETDSDSKKPRLAGSYESHSYAVASLGVLPSIKQDVTSDAYLELGPQKTTRELLFKWMRRADIHLGKKTCSPLMKPFLSRDQEPGVNTIDLERTWDQLQEAARVIVGVECSGDILVASDSMMPECDVIQDFVLCTGISYYTGSCYNPGTLTAGRRPDLIILSYPKTEDHLRLFEDACRAGIPMIAFCETDTDIPKEYVDGTTIIPANCSKRALGWLFWFLTRMVLQVRGYRSEDDMWEEANVPSLHSVPSMHRDGVSWEEWEEYCEERKKIDDENLDHIPIIHHVTPVERLGEWEQYERVSEECVRVWEECDYDLVKCHISGSSMTISYTRKDAIGASIN